MCGIFGYFNIPYDGKIMLYKMAAQQIHRGPDSEGFYTDDTIGIGIRRLSVIDLVTGDQPIHNEDESIWVVCNGEIYNYIELDKELINKGHRYYTKSDVECIVHIYEEYGIQGIKQLNGMYGFALYDTKIKKLFLVRDRLGVKPLYFTLTHGGLLFGSELRSLLASGLVDASFDWNAISFFLDQLYIPTPFSPFASIKKLKPGHYMEITFDQGCHIKERQYWDINDAGKDNHPITEEGAIEKLSFLLKDSHRLQLRADVPVCVFLSGGVDSSAVVAFAARQVTSPLRTFHVYFEGATNKRDERHQARMVAQRYGTEHSEVCVNGDSFKKLIPRLIWHLEEPFGDLACVPTFIISEMARKEATVCLNGSGGDELFAGYSHHNYAFHIKQSAISMMEKIGIANHMRSVFGKEIQTRDWSSLFPDYYNIKSRQMPEDKGKAFHGDLRNKIMARDIDGYLQSNVLFLLDKVAMAVSLEGRVPLLDHRIVEFASHLPSCMKIKKGEKKYIFKKILEPYLPREVLYAKKEGFGAPLKDWLDDETTGILRKIIKNGRLKHDKMLDLSEPDIDALKGWDLWKISCLDLWSQIIAQPGECPKNNTLLDYI